MPSTPTPPKHNIRFVEVRGVRYLHTEDVQKYILSLAGGEEVDVRNRLTEAAENLRKGGPSGPPPVRST